MNLRPDFNSDWTQSWPYACVARNLKVGDQCWEWTGRKSRNGYGRITVLGVERAAHRVIWTMLGGRIPPGRVLDHLCGNKACCRPSHLEPVTVAENLKRAKMLRDKLGRYKTKI